MPWYCWLFIALVLVSFLIMLYGLLAASGDYNRKQEEENWEREHRKNQNENDSEWF